MAIEQMTDQKTFANWRDITNSIIDALGDLTLLPTTNKDNIVESVTEIEERIETLETDNTGDQDVFSTVSGDSGSASAEEPGDNLAIAGGFGITTEAAGDTVTVTNSDSGSAALSNHNSTYDHSSYDTHLVLHSQGETAADAITTSASNVVTFPLATYQAAKVILVANDGTNIYASEVLIAHDGTNAQLSESNVVDVPDAGLEITYTVDINSGDVRLRAATGAGTATIKFDITLIPV